MRTRPLNIEKYKWMYLNPHFHLNKNINKLKWGLSTARVDKYEDVTEMYFFFNGEFVKKYFTQDPTMEWVDSRIRKYFESAALDKFVKDDDNPLSFKGVSLKYQGLTGSLR